MEIFTSLMCFKVFGVSLVTAVINYRVANFIITMRDIIMDSWKIYLFAGMQLALYIIMVVAAVAGIWKM